METLEEGLRARRREAAAQRLKRDDRDCLYWGSNAKASNAAVTKKKTDGNSSKNGKHASSRNDDDSDDRSSPPKLNPRLSVQRQTEVRAATLFGEYASNTSDDISAPLLHCSLQMLEA